MELCSAYRCVVTQHQCSAAKFRAKCNPHCSVLLCRTGLQQAVCLCSYTYRDLLFIHVCSDPAPMHCSNVQGKMQSPLFSAALPKRLTAGLGHCNLTCGELLFMQVCSDSTEMHCSKVQGKVQSPLFSAALQNRLTAGTVSLQLKPMDSCSSCRCAVTQHQCSAAKFRAKCNPHCSVLLCKTGLQQAVCHCSYTYGDLLFIHMCSDPAPMHCNKVQGNMQSPLFSAALQNRLTAGLGHCNHTCGELLFIQMCSDPTPIHCSSVQGKMQSPLFSAAL